MSHKPKLVHGALPSIAPQLADLMVTRLGMDAICKAAKKYGVFGLIRPELPVAVTDSEVFDIANILYEKAGEANAPLPVGVPGASYSIYLPE